MVFTILEVVIIVKGINAYSKHLFSRRQANRKYGSHRRTKVAVFAEHGGMWGYFFILSPLCAGMVALLASEWTLPNITIALSLSIVVGSLMIKKWAKDNNGVIETFVTPQKVVHEGKVYYEKGKTTGNGWIHYGYMVVCLTLVFLMFFFTKKVDGWFLWLTVAGLPIHLCLGLLQPEFNTHGKVSTSNKLIVLGLSIVLVARGYFLSN